MPPDDPRLLPRRPLDLPRHDGGPPRRDRHLPDLDPWPVDPVTALPRTPPGGALALLIEAVDLDRLTRTEVLEVVSACRRHEQWLRTTIARAAAALVARR